jgi:hypothetical protein
VSGTEKGFVLRASFDQDELLGARWWNEQLVLSGGPTRREALQRLGIGTLGLMTVGAIVSGVRGCSPGAKPATVLRPGVDVQREQGWNVEADGASLTYPGAVDVDVDGRPFARERLARLRIDLCPSGRLVECYGATLFQFVSDNDPRRSEALGALRPIHTPAMQAAYLQGASLRELLQGVDAPRDLALVVDLPGECSVAFAAGLVPAAEPVFAFENWPHPRGVVPAHLVLAAALYYQPLFARRPLLPERVPAFVLDRNRLAPFDAGAGRFNNRYVARLPGRAELQQLGIGRVLYVVPGDAAQELDDLVQLFDEWRAGGIEVRLVSLGDFRPETAPPSPANVAPRYYYFGSPLHHWWFWRQYPWYSLPVGIAPVEPQQPPIGARWTPGRRPTMFDHLDPRGIGRVHDRVAEREIALQQPAPPTAGGGSSWGRSRSWGFS